MNKYSAIIDEINALFPENTQILIEVVTSKKDEEKFNNYLEEQFKDCMIIDKGITSQVPTFIGTSYTERDTAEIRIITNKT